MTERSTTLKPWNPGLAFFLGLAGVMLAVMAPLPAWSTFIHTWRVEIAASLFLFATLAYLIVRPKRISGFLSKTEIRWIVFPILAFILWSGVSALWAPSWQSAIHHTLIWCEYLIFYLIIRYLVDHERNFRKLLWTFTIVLVLFAIPAVIDYLALTAFEGDTFFRARFAKYGEQIITLLPLLIVFTFRSSGRSMYSGLAAVVVLWLLVYLSAGRVNLFLYALVIVTLAILVFAFSRFKRYRLKFAVLILLIAAAPVPLHIFSMLTASSAEVPILARFNDTAGSAYSNNFRLLMNSVSLEMVKSAPITGIGADNYGLQFNNFREAYALKNPDDLNLAHGEVGIVALAHNEFFQIVSELGIVGGIIFLWFLSGIGLLVFRVLRDLNRVTLHSAAAVIGLLMFLASSLVSAYSFRVMQNGVLFFFVLAVGAKTLLKDRDDARIPATPHAFTTNRFVLAGGMVACVALCIYTGVRLRSVILTKEASEQRDFESADALYKKAISLDADNPDPRRTLGMLLLRKKRYAESASWLRESIRIGRGESPDYSYLATALSLSGDENGAEMTMAQAADLYPQSSFVLTRYSELLERNGKAVESSAVFERALAIDGRSARTWLAMITQGPKIVSELAARDSSYMTVMDLQPKGSIYAVTTERYMKHPEEQRFSLLKVTMDE